MDAPEKAAVLPPAAVEMSVSAVWAHLGVLREMAGENADATACVTASDAPAAVRLSVWPKGIGKGDERAFWAPSWPEAIDAAYAWAVWLTVDARRDAVRRMALDIIDLTEIMGACHATQLRHRGSWNAQLVREACDLASKMAGNAPFLVVRDLVEA